MKPADIRISPMIVSEYHAFRGMTEENFALQGVKAGAWGEEEAFSEARARIEKSIPQGMATPQHHFFAVRDAHSEENVAGLWIALQDERGATAAYIHSISVFGEFRGQGYGRASMQACIAEARRMGANSLSLNVFGHNATARSLYTSLGFNEVSVVMSLPLDRKTR